MSEFGVIVLPRAQWPIIFVGSAIKQVACRPDTRMFTTQKYVWVEVVDQKKKRISDGERLVVSLAFREKRSWLIDGHHTLVAYRSLGVDRFPCAFYGPGSDLIQAPKLES